MRNPTVGVLVSLLCGCQDVAPKPEGPAAASAASTSAKSAGEDDAGVDISSPAVPADTWMEFASEEGKFRVRFPAAPSKDTAEIPTLVGSVKQTTHSAGEGDVHFGVAYGEYPPEAMKDFDLDKGLDGARNGAINNVGGTLLAEQQITFAGQPARAFQGKATVQGIELLLDARVFMLDNRLYQLIVVHPSTSQNLASGKFFDSFSLVDG